MAPVVVTIRQYRPTDLASCRALWAELTEHHRQLYEDATIGGDDPGGHFDQHLAQVGPELIWVADNQGQVIGFVSLIIAGEEATVEPVIVTAEYRRRGIGRALLLHAVREATQRRARFLNIRPVARNMEAMSLFYSAGFELLGQVELFMDLRPELGRTWRDGATLMGLRLRV